MKVKSLEILESHSIRSAWIEIISHFFEYNNYTRRTPRNGGYREFLF